MSGVLWFLAGGAVVGLPAFRWARLHRAHRDYRDAKAAVPKGAARTATATAFLKVSLVGLVAIVVALYAAARRM